MPCSVKKLQLGAEVFEVRIEERGRVLYVIPYYNNEGGQFQPVWEELVFEALILVVVC